MLGLPSLKLLQIQFTFLNEGFSDGEARRILRKKKAKKFFDAEEVFIQRQFINLPLLIKPARYSMPSTPQSNSVFTILIDSPSDNSGKM
jgi:hypothetical protein